MKFEYWPPWTNTTFSYGEILAWKQGKIKTKTTFLHLRNISKSMKNRNLRPFHPFFVHMNDFCDCVLMDEIKSSYEEVWVLTPRYTNISSTILVFSKHQEFDDKLRMIDFSVECPSFESVRFSVDTSVEVSEDYSFVYRKKVQVKAAFGSLRPRGYWWWYQNESLSNKFYSRCVDVMIKNTVKGMKSVVMGETSFCTPWKINIDNKFEIWTIRIFIQP